MRRCLDKCAVHTYLSRMPLLKRQLRVRRWRYFFGTLLWWCHDIRRHEWDAKSAPNVRVGHPRQIENNWVKHGKFTSWASLLPWTVRSISLSNYCTPKIWVESLAQDQAENYSVLQKVLEARESCQNEVVLMTTYTQEWNVSFLSNPF